MLQTRSESQKKNVWEVVFRLWPGARKIRIVRGPCELGGVAVSENKMNNNKLPNMKIDLTSERRRRSRPQISFWRFEDKTGGGGKGENKIWQIQRRGPESGPQVNCACFKSDLFFMYTVQI